MKLSVEIYELSRRFGDEKAIEMIKAAGFDAFDYSFYEENEAMVSDDFRTKANNVKQFTLRNDICCNQAHAPYSLKYGEPFDLTNDAYRRVVNSIEFASILGADNIIVHAINTPDEEFDEYNQRYYKSLLPYAEKFKIHIAVENLFKTDKNRNFLPVLETPEELQDFIKRLDSHWFVACIDVGYAALFGDVGEFIRRMDKDVLKALHIHDNDFKDDLHLFPYSGKINWNSVCEALRGIGYNADFTFEISEHLRKFDDDLLETALGFACDIGRNLLNKIQR